MLGRSWRGAAVMAAALLSASLLANIALAMLRQAGLENTPLALTGPAGRVPAVAWLSLCLGLGVFLSVPAALAVLVIRRLDRRHFGRQGLARWLLVGLVHALLVNLVAIFLAPIFPGSAGARAVFDLLQGALLLAALIVAYWLVFHRFTRLRPAGPVDRQPMDED